MAEHGIFQYIRLKIIATFLRLVVGLFERQDMKREAALVNNDHRELVQIPSRDKGRFIAAWLYSGPTAATSTEKKPVLINWHGSGFILPNLSSDAGWCSQVAREVGCLVVDADYRKAPETPFPGPLNDVEDTLRWVATQPDRFDLGRVAVSGFSAGGNLALVAASSLRGSLETIHIPIVVAFYPPTNLSIDPAKKTVLTRKRPIPARVARLFNSCYLPPGILREDPRISPSLADSKLFPDTVVIITCDGDTLSPEANDLGKKLEHDGRKVVNVVLEDASHGFDKHSKPGSSDWKKREYSYSLAIQSLIEAFRL